MLARLDRTLALAPVALLFAEVAPDILEMVEVALDAGGLPSQQQPAEAAGFRFLFVVSVIESPSLLAPHG